MIKLNQALKQKNRLTGELNRLQTIMQRENSRRNDNVSKVNVEEIWKQIQDTVAKLTGLKSKIAAANVGIYPTIEKMAELKSQIAFLQRLQTREGEEKTQPFNSQPLTYTWTAYLNQEKVDAEVKKLQVEIEALQDQIDTYNAVTEI